MRALAFVLALVAVFLAANGTLIKIIDAARNPGAAGGVTP